MGSEYSFTTDVEKGIIALSNSTSDNHGSVLGKDYYNYSLLFDIRNNKELTYNPTSSDENVMINDLTLFHAGDSFSLSEYHKQFVRDTTLNNGKALGWSFSIESITASEGGYKASINLKTL